MPLRQLLIDAVKRCALVYRHPLHFFFFFALNDVTEIVLYLFIGGEKSLCIRVFNFTANYFVLYGLEIFKHYALGVCLIVVLSDSFG